MLVNILKERGAYCACCERPIVGEGIILEPILGIDGHFIDLAFHLSCSFHFFLKLSVDTREAWLHELETTRLAMLGGFAKC